MKPPADFASYALFAAEAAEAYISSIVGFNASMTLAEIYAYNSPRFSVGIGGGAVLTTVYMAGGVMVVELVGMLDGTLEVVGWTMSGVLAVRTTIPSYDTF
jgi:hypothetical protein